MLWRISRGQGSPRALLWFVGGVVLKDRRCAREPSLGWRVAVLVQVVSRFLSVVVVCGCLGVLAAVGWFLWWLSCFLSVESG